MNIPDIIIQAANRFGIPKGLVLAIGEEEDDRCPLAK
jgi:hypothetical protein